MRAIAVLLTVLVFVPATELGAAEDRSSRRVRGSKEPERIPDWKAWEHLFAFLESIANGTTDAKAPEVDAFVRHNLYISSEDTSVLLRVTARVRAGIAELSNRDDQDFEAEQGLTRTGTQGGRIRQQHEERLVSEARDEILAAVSPRGAKALLRYVAAVIKPGMEVTVHE